MIDWHFQMLSTPCIKSEARAAHLIRRFRLLQQSVAAGYNLIRGNQQTCSSATMYSSV